MIDGEIPEKEDRLLDVPSIYLFSKYLHLTETFVLLCRNTRLPGRCKTGLSLWVSVVPIFVPKTVQWNPGPRDVLHCGTFGV